MIVLACTYFDAVDLQDLSAVGAYPAAQRTKERKRRPGSANVMISYTNLKSLNTKRIPCEF